MSGFELERLEANIKRSQQFVAVGESLERLYGNRDFKKVILEGYFEQEAIRLVHLKADDNMQNPESQRAILAQMDAIGSLKNHLGLLMRNAEMAGKTLAFDEQTRDELLMEGK